MSSANEIRDKYPPCSRCSPRKRLLYFKKGFYTEQDGSYFVLRRVSCGTYSRYLALFLPKLAAASYFAFLGHICPPLEARKQRTLSILSMCLPLQVSLQGHNSQNTSLEMFPKSSCLCYCFCLCLFVGQVMCILITHQKVTCVVCVSQKQVGSYSVVLIFGIQPFLLTLLHLVI